MREVFSFLYTKELNTTFPFAGYCVFEHSYLFIHNFGRLDCHQSGSKGTKVT